MKFSCKKMLSIAALSLMALSALSTTSSVSASKPHIYIDNCMLETGAGMGIMCHTYRDVDGLVNQMIRYDNEHHNLSRADRRELTSIKHRDDTKLWYGGPNPYHEASLPTLQQAMFDLSGENGFHPGFIFGRY